MQVTIESLSVPDYVHSSRKHVEVRGTSGKLEFTVTAQQISALASASAIVGVIDSRKNILKHVRLIIGAREARRIIGIAKSSFKPLPAAEDNRTFFVERAHYSHHYGRCMAYKWT